MSKDNGGQAFPCKEIRGRNEGGELVSVSSVGMTLRDYFAAKASDNDVDLIMMENTSDEWNATVGAMPHLAPVIKRTYKITRQQARYIHADEMLEARK